MNPSLIEELCRVLHSSDGMMRMAMYHRQVTVDGYVVLPDDDRRWNRRQLAGRTAKLYSREGRLFDGSRSTYNTTQVEA